MGNVNTDIGQKITNKSSGKRYIYSRAKISNSNIPLVFLLGFQYGLEKVLNTYNVNYKFSTTPLKLGEDKNKYNSIRFKDGFLYFKTNPIRHAILINGMNSVDCREYNFKDFNSTDVYLDIFELLFGSKNKAKGFSNIMTLFLDPITKDVLKTMDLPTDMLNIMLYANSLLEDSSSKKLNDMTNYRIRSNELIYAELYNVLSEAFRVYKDTAKAGSPKKISTPQDAVLKRLLESPLMDEYSTLNPILEVEKSGTITYKGLAGSNKEPAFTIDMRAYDETMIGCMGMSSPDSNKIGVNCRMAPIKKPF